MSNESPVPRVLPQTHRGDIYFGSVTPTRYVNSVGLAWNLPWTPEVLSKVKTRAERIVNESLSIVRADWELIGICFFDAEGKKIFPRDHRISGSQSSRC